METLANTFHQLNQDRDNIVGGFRSWLTFDDQKWVHDRLLPNIYTFAYTRDDGVRSLLSVNEQGQLLRRQFFSQETGKLVTAPINHTAVEELHNAFTDIMSLGRDL
jgi:hypothetical protein